MSSVCCFAFDAAASSSRFSSSSLRSRCDASADASCAFFSARRACASSFAGFAFFPFLEEVSTAPSRSYSA